MQKIPKVIIIGGGVGGLAAANALTLMGADWEIHENSAEIGIGGTGLTLWPNAMRALSSIGLEKSISSHADPLDLGEIFDWRHKKLKSVPLHEVQAKSGLPLLCLRRVDLYTELLKPLDRSKIFTNRKCIGFSQITNGVRLEFKDSSPLDAELVIAADGVRSRLRDQMLGFNPLNYVGWMTWRGIAQLPADSFPKSRYQEFFGKGSRFGVFWIGDNYVYWYGTLNSIVHDKPTIDPAHKAEALAHFAGWPSLASKVITLTKTEDLVRTGVYDTAPLPRWTNGVIALLGDAAHPMTPDLGQGACQAINDGIELVQCLQTRNTVAEALTEYERLGLARTSPLVARSRKIGKMRQWQNPAAVMLRNTVIKAMPQRSLLGFFEAK